VKFAELPEKEKIQSVKDALLRLIDKLYNNPNDHTQIINEYFKLVKPTPLTPVPEPITDSMSSEQKLAIEERTKDLLQKVKEDNEKLELEFNLKVESAKKFEALVNGLSKREDCICGCCFNVNIIDGILPSELEPLLPLARQMAEENTY
jgi:hypothetical protein